MQKSTTAPTTNLVLPGIILLLVTNKSRSAFPSENHYQGQLNIPQSVIVHIVPQLENFFINYEGCSSDILSWIFLVEGLKGC
jgi:hypothetical protein